MLQQSQVIQIKEILIQQDVRFLHPRSPLPPRRVSVTAEVRFTGELVID